MHYPNRIALAAVLSIFANVAAHADQPACDRVSNANENTGSANVRMTSTGYNFAADTPGIYALGTHTCSYVRDEVIDGEAAAVYREQYRSKTGTTVALIWISKNSGRVLREEEDGDIAGKGKGHIAYRWSSAKH